MHFRKLDSILLLFASREASKWCFERRRGAKHKIQCPKNTLGGAWVGRACWHTFVGSTTQKFKATLVVSACTMMHIHLQKGTALFKRWLRLLILVTFNKSWAGRELLKCGLLPTFAKGDLYLCQELSAKFCVDCGHCSVERRRISLDILWIFGYISKEYLWKFELKGCMVV